MRNIPSPEATERTGDEGEVSLESELRPIATPRRRTEDVGGLCTPSRRRSETRFVRSLTRRSLLCGKKLQKQTF